MPDYVVLEDGSRVLLEDDSGDVLLEGPPIPAVAAQGPVPRPPAIVAAPTGAPKPVAVISPWLAATPTFSIATTGVYRIEVSGRAGPSDPFPATLLLRSGSAILAVSMRIGPSGNPRIDATLTPGNYIVDVVQPGRGMARYVFRATQLS